MPNDYDPQLIERLSHARGAANSLITVHLPPDRPLHVTLQGLRAELAAAGNIKSRLTRKGVERALMRLTHLAQTSAPSDRGWVLFAGEAREGGFIEAVVAPPQRVTSYAYRCGNRFDLETIAAMLRPTKCIALLVIDRREATLGLWHGGDVETLYTDTSLVPGKHHHGGQSAQRFERLTEEAAVAWYREVARHVRDAIQPHADAGRLDAILVGGPGLSKQAWLRDANLDARLRALVAPQTFDVGYTDAAGLRDLARAARDWVQAEETAAEVAEVERFFTRLARDEPVAYGAEVIEDALRAGRIETMLLSRADEALEAAVEAQGGRVVRVSDRSEAGRMFRQAFGTAAIARYDAA